MIHEKQGCVAHTKYILAKSSGPGYSKLTISLVNVSLKFQTLRAEIRQYVLLKNVKILLHCKKTFIIFSTKNTSVFGYIVIKYLTS